MIDLIKRMFTKRSKKEINRKEVDIICNNPPANLDGFCNLEFANINRRSN